MESDGKNRPSLKQRVVSAAESALADHQYVNAIDVFLGMGFLSPGIVKPWRNGIIGILEPCIQGSPKKRSLAMQLFREWAEEQGLTPSEAAYVRTTRTGNVNLQFTVDGDSADEKFFRTHYISPHLPERKQKQIAEKASRTPDPVVFQIVRESECSECGAEIWKNGLLLMEAGQPLCLPCAQLDNLEFLPSGDAALTRRSTKYSGRKAVVVRFSQSRGRYERQGILVESAALEKAEQECAADADDRARARAAGARRRQEQDLILISEMATAIATLFPRCPPAEAAVIAIHTAARSSGRVGRTEAGRKLDPKALTLAVTAAVRHNHTGYDKLLSRGVDRATARQEIGAQVQEILAGWRS